MDLRITSLTAFAIIGAGAAVAPAQRNGPPPITPVDPGPELRIESTRVEHRTELDLLVFEMTLEGSAGETTPAPAGQMNGAPVLAYVFPTSLAPEDVGFGGVEGTVALAVTSHPDFDDTPLWDENLDRNYKNDGVIWHTHWVVLTGDDRVPGGLKVAEFEKGDSSVTMPPTNPGMPMYLDSPGLTVVQRGDTLKVLVPAWRVSNNTTFTYDGVTAYMQVMQSGDYPLLGVYEVYDTLQDELAINQFVVRR